MILLSNSHGERLQTLAGRRQAAQAAPRPSAEAEGGLVELPGLVRARRAYLAPALERPLGAKDGPWSKGGPEEKATFAGAVLAALQQAREACTAHAQAFYEAHSAASLRGSDADPRLPPTLSAFLEATGYLS